MPALNTPARSDSSSPISKRSNRKSWFAIRRRAKQRTATGDTSPLPPPSAFNYEPTPQPDTRLGPLQFAPNRLQSLYITPSERNLYLAAMSQLDQGPQPLALWAEPPPILPRLPLSPPMDTAPPNAGAPTAQHPLTTVPLSPKLVTSPGLPGSGLMVREEFRRPQSPSKATRHALLCLLPTSFLRFTGFPPKTIIAIDRIMSENWPQGVWLRSEDMDKMSKRNESGENLTWRAELHGRAWKVKGSQELESIRLLLAMLTTLATHGWTLVGSVQAAGMKKTCHNLLFRYDPHVEARPPAFFALSMPLADRLSIISPPNKSTPAILNAVRSAITSNSHLTESSQNRANSVEMQNPEASKRLTWGKEGQAKGVKLEGWVHPGVFRFWIAGMRRWLGGTVKHGKVDNLHPSLLMSIMNHLSSIHFELAGSIPLLPLAKGRDVLFFYSLPASGLTHLDSYRPDATAGPSSGSESVVLVSRPSSPPVTETQEHSRLPTDNSGVPEGRRVLPWTSILSEEPPTSQGRVKKASDGSSSAAPPISSMRQAFARQRTSSEESNRPLLPQAFAASPKQKNVLLKKNSLRRRSASATGSVDLPPPEPSVTTNLPGAGVAATDTTLRESDQWSMIDVPAHVGRLGVTHYSPGPDTLSMPYGETSAPPNRQMHDSAPRPSNETTSDESVYEDTNETIHHTAPPELSVPQNPPQLPPRPAQRAQETLLDPIMSLGNPVNPDADMGQGETVPLREPATSRRAGSAMVDVGGGIGVPSMHGSVGFFPTGQSVISDGGHSESVAPPVPPPKAGSSRTRMSVGR